MRRLSRRERGLIAAAVAALVIFVYAFGLLLPMRDRAQKLAQQEASLDRKIAEAERMYRGVPELVADIARLRRQVDRLMFQAEETPVAMVQELDGLASDLGMTVTSVDPGDPEQVAGCVRYPMTLKVDSDFASLMRLLYALEQPEHRLWVEGVEITSARRGAGELGATFYVAAYAAGKESEDAEA